MFLVQADEQQAFYLPVTMLAHKKPAVGALMRPKTLIYVWMICMGLEML